MRMESFAQDLRHAGRALVRAPGFTMTAVLTLALGIGAATAVFSVLNGVLLRPLPYPEPDRLLRLWDVRPEGGRENVNPLNVADWRARSRTLEIAAYGTRPVTLAGTGQAERLMAGRVTGNFFALLGARAAAGRAFAAEEDVPGAEPVVVLSHALWTRRYGADPGVVGRAVSVDGVPHRVAGVMEAGFDPPQYAQQPDPQLWVPLRISERMGRGGHWLNAVGRLRPGATPEAAAREMARISAQIDRENPGANPGWGMLVEPLHRSIVGDTRPVLLVLLGATVLVLLIACANVASLLLARGAWRTRETAIRAALGAGRGRLAASVLAEAVLLATVGGGLGVLTAAWAVQSLAALAPAGLPRVDEIGVDARVLAFAAGASLLTALLFGVAPALRASRSDLHPLLRGGTATRGRRRGLPNPVVVAQVALAVVLAVGAGLLLRSLDALLAVDPGFRAERVLTAEISLPEAEYDETRGAAFLDALVARMQAVPGATSAGAVNILPLGGGYSCDGIEAADRPGADVGCAETRIVTPGYLSTLGIPLLRGRGVSETDRAGSPPVVVVNETLASRLWPGASPIGRRIVYNGEAREVVGMVRDVRHFGLAADAAGEMYLPQAQLPSPWQFTLAVRTTGDPAALGPTLRQALREMDPAVAAGELRTMEQMVAASVAAPRFRALLLGVFAGAALLLTVVGIYGVVAFTVGRRTREIGLRVALGAQRGGVLRLVLRDGLRMAVAGVALGLLLALPATRALRSLLFGVGAADPLTFAAVPVLLVAAALLASWLPARRAARVEPMVALRQE